MIKRIGRWQDWDIFAIGFWLFCSPWILSFSPTDESAKLCAYGTATVIIFAATCAICLRQLWEEIVNALVGIWMIAAPWVMKFNSDRVATTDMLVVGLVVMTLAVWAGFRDDQIFMWRRRHGLP